MIHPELVTRKLALIAEDFARIQELARQPLEVYQDRGGSTASPP